MKIRNDILKSSSQHLTSIPCSPEPLEAQMEGIFDGLHQTLDTIRAEYLNRDIYYYTYRLITEKQEQPQKSAPLWQVVKRALFTKEPSPRNDLPLEVDPWSESTVQFWTLVGANPQFHDLAKKWLNSVEDLLIFANGAPSSTMGVWELDETQFAEPAIATLALLDLSFVPFYTKLLGLWDMDHEADQYGVIAEIIDKYGVCPETENLMICRMTEGHGQHGRDSMEHFRPALDAHYNDLSQSDFLRRMVVREHEWDVARYEKHVENATEDFERRRKIQSDAQMRYVAPPMHGCFRLDENKNLSESAQRIFDALEKKRLS